ncbi:sacsin N-terminal ATP-binding-like domain-containing protein [Cupriavidus basilensis]
MAKYTTNYVNLIADNLRDRYKRGFPILKELVQNADDAGAGSLVFGHHSGFAETEVAHPLLRGPALWVFNDGAFEPKDKQSIQSFGLNAKAADDGAIGKFGLGMKSVLSPL